MNKDDLRWLITNYTEPIVFKNLLKWNFINWDLEKWKSAFGKEPLRYRCGKLSVTKNPQWEKKSDYITGTIDDFLRHPSDNPNTFVYCDYKYLTRNFKSISEIQDEVRWDSFGFPDYTSDRSTIWIGTKGAHTPCHVDTYGSNLVAQVYGTKRWILFPPGENLHPTRVPYEESSVFSRLNLFSPEINEFNDIKRCKSIILQPGDVLFVPHGWWHYVENLDVAISINAWISRDGDVIKQFDESLVQLMVSRLTKDLDEREKDVIILPSNENFEEDTNLEDLLKIIELCKNDCSGEKKRKIDNPLIKQETEKFDVKEVLIKYKEFIEVPPYLTKDQFNALIKQQLERFPSGSIEEDVLNFDDMLIKLINAFTNDEVLNLVKENLFNK